MIVVHASVWVDLLRGALPAGYADRIREPIDSVAAVGLIDNATYADALYLALARRLSYQLMTLDRGMQNAARIHGVELVDLPG